jgi:hypothetical protein
MFGARPIAAPARKLATVPGVFRKPSENEGSETQQRQCFVSPKIGVPKYLISGTSSPGFATTGRRTINPP